MSHTVSIAVPEEGSIQLSTAESEFQESVIHPNDSNKVIMLPGTDSGKITEVITASTKSAVDDVSHLTASVSANNMIEITAINPHYFDFLKLIGEGSLLVDCLFLNHNYLS